MTWPERLPDDALPGMLGGGLAPGIYRWFPAGTESGVQEALGSAARAGWQGAVLDLSGVRDKTAFLHVCAEALALPASFGRNWDALHDCLIDFSWWPEPVPPGGYLLLIRAWEELRRSVPDIAQPAGHILENAAAHWRGRGVPLTVLLG